MKRNGLPALLFALIFTAGLAGDAESQHSVRAGLGASDSSPSAPGATTGLRYRSEFSPTVPARRPMRPFLVGGALVGAVVGALLAASFHDSFCGEPAPGYSCSSTSPVAGAMIGAGVGVVAGWLLWALTTPAAATPPAPARLRAPPPSSAGR